MELYQFFFFLTRSDLEEEEKKADGTSDQKWGYSHMKSSRVDFVCTASVVDKCRPDDFSLPQIGMSETQSTIHRRTPTLTDRYIHTQTHDQTGQEAAQHTIVLEERAQKPSLQYTHHPVHLSR